LTTVVLTETKDYSRERICETVARALDGLNYDLDDDVNSVVIKPNLCYYWDYSTGETTDPRVVSAVIEWLRQKIGEDVSIAVGEADASAMRTKYAFKMLGYEKLCQEKNVKLVNLSEGEIIEKEAVVAGEKFVLPVNKMLLDADLLVNVPKMKCHRTVGFTCALKNMFGAISKPRKYVYHEKLAKVIVGINKIVKTDLVLVDGIIACGKVPKKVGVVMAGDDPVATDITAAKAMNFNPQSIGYLKLAIKEKIGNINSVDVIENPVKIEHVKKKFPRYNYSLQKIYWNLQLGMLKTYARIIGDVIPPILLENDE
jgi:uncharacterized protein (DUF362 family)